MNAPIIATEDDRLAPDNSIEVVQSDSGRAVRLGHGGNRGSCVFLVKEAGTDVEKAFKACRMHPPELAFCRAIHKLIGKFQHKQPASGSAPRSPVGVASSAESTASTPNRDDGCWPEQLSEAEIRRVRRGLAFLAIPEKLVTTNALMAKSFELLQGEHFVAQPQMIDSTRNTPAPPSGDHLLLRFPTAPVQPLLGIIMPRYSATLYQVLSAPRSCSSSQRPTPAKPSDFPAFPSELAPETSALFSRKKFEADAGAFTFADGSDITMRQQSMSIESLARKSAELTPPDQRQDSEEIGDPSSDDEEYGKVNEESDDSREAKSATPLNDNSPTKPSPAFHSTARQRRIESVEVISCVLYQVVHGLAALANLEHEDPRTSTNAPSPSSTTSRTTTTTSSSSPVYRGFAHRDLREDNILVHSSGAVALCDFELVAHIRDGSSNLENSLASANQVGRRILPPAYHPPEGTMNTGVDAWLLGLLALELFTGVSPLIYDVVAHDNFGDGPLLEVDSELGVDWKKNVRDHVHTFIRPFEVADAQKSEKHADPTSLDTPTPNKDTETRKARRRAQEALYMKHFESFLGLCLCNDPSQRGTPLQLATHPLLTLFEEMHKTDITRPLRRWLARHPLRDSRLAM